MKIRTDGRTGKQFVSCPRGGGRPAIYLDGTLVDGGPTGPSSLFRAGAMSPVFDLENFPPGQAEAVEVYKSPAERPVEYNSSGALCVVLLWTRRGP
jgi:hypothetical protein